MQDSFDPYLEWLGIVVDDGQPSLYELLDLPRFEQDDEKISSEIESRSKLVRSLDHGEHPEALRKILKQFATARETLLDPERKAGYDTRLRKQQSETAPGKAMSDSLAKTSSPQKKGPSDRLPGVNIVTDATDKASSSKRPSKKASPSQMPVIIGSVAGGVLVLLVTAIYLATRPSTEPPDELALDPYFDSHPDPSPSVWTDPYKLDPENLPRRSGSSHRSNPSSNRAPRPRGPSTMADLMNEDTDDQSANAGTVTGMLISARRAMGGRDRIAARHHVESARNTAKSKTEKNEVQRVEKLLDSLDTFWESAKIQYDRLAAAREIELDEAIIIVVDKTGDHLIIRHAGKNLSFGFSDLPTKLLVGIARKGWVRNSQTENLHVGSFMAVDFNGDREEACRLWEQAGPQGKALLPELELVPKPQKTAGTESSTRSPTIGQNPGILLPHEPSTPKKPTRPPVPDATLRAHAESEIREIFKTEFASAHNAEKKKALAKSLFEMGKKTEDDPAAHYVLLKLAADLATDLGDPAAIGWVIDEIGNHYEIDTMLEKAKAYTQSWRSKDSVLNRPELGRQSAILFRQAMDEDNLDAAKEVLDVAIAATRASKDYRTLRELEEFKSHLRSKDR